MKINEIYIEKTLGKAVYAKQSLAMFSPEE